MSYAAGGLFAAGWFVFVDAAVQHATERIEPPLEPAYAVPGALATISLLMVCAAPYKAFGDSMGSLVTPSHASCARLWLFTAFLLGFVSMAAASMIAGAMRYGQESRFAYRGRVGGGSDYEQVHLWLGSSTMVQTIVIFSATLMWLATRLQVLDEQAL